MKVASDQQQQSSDLPTKALEAYQQNRDGLRGISEEATYGTAQEVVSLIREILGPVVPDEGLEINGPNVRFGHYLFLTEVSYQHGHGLLCKWICERCGEFGGEVHIQTLTALGFVEYEYRKHFPDFCRPDAKR